MLHFFITFAFMNCNGNITFLSFFHAASDERIWFHQRPALIEQGFSVSVVSGVPSSADVATDNSVFEFDFRSHTLSQRVSIVLSALSYFAPRIIICDTPLAVIAASRYGKSHSVSILFDITERYPSLQSLNGKPFIKRLIHKPLMQLCNWHAASLCDGFIFGEHYKSLYYSKHFPNTPHVRLSYYPDLKYIHSTPPRQITQECCLFYSGSTSKTSGFINVVSSAVRAAQLSPTTKFVLRIITNDEVHIKAPDNLKISISPYMPFVDFCQAISEADIFFDLRVVNSESVYSLPIKLFYFFACGRPAVYFDNVAIHDHIGTKNNCCHLVNPNDYDSIATIINDYINNPGLYLSDCSSARRLAETQFNWDNIKGDFLDFVSRF